MCEVEICFELKYQEFQTVRNERSQGIIDDFFESEAEEMEKGI